MNQLLTTKPRVLVVDSEAMSRTLIDAVLRTGDRYDVIGASSGTEGMTVARQIRPDLMLVNIGMPGDHDGFDVCRTLKAEPSTRRMPIVLMTSQANTSERVQGIESGADDFLTKPFNRIELLARVRSLLRIKALNDQLDEVEDVIYSLSRAVEMRSGGDYDAQTGRVLVYVDALGRALGLNDEALRTLQQATLLRDVGKIGLPDKILNKPGLLDPEEQQHMQQHIMIGEQIIRPLRSTASLLPIIRHHHERVDGKGYPDGLEGDDIPLGARIVAIGDAYAAMLSPRPYRPAFSPAKAIVTLQAGAGKQWDARLVDIFVAWALKNPATAQSTK